MKDPMNDDEYESNDEQIAALKERVEDLTNGLRMAEGVLSSRADTREEDSNFLVKILVHIRQLLAEGD